MRRWELHRSRTDPRTLLGRSTPLLGHAAVRPLTQPPFQFRARPQPPTSGHRRRAIGPSDPAISPCRMELPLNDENTGCRAELRTAISDAENDGDKMAKELDQRLWRRSRIADTDTSFVDRL